MNERVTAPQVMVIGADGEQLGVMPSAQALSLARERNLDLVEVAPTNAPPVCRILDYGRLRYLSAKKERESRKSQKNTSLREMRMRPHIGTHDLSAKVRKLRELLGDGSKVKVSVFFRGREVTHQQLGMSLLKQVVDMLEGEAKLEKPPSMEARYLSIILAPQPHKAKRKSGVEEASDAKAEDAQGSTGEISGDGLGSDPAEEADEQSQPPEEAQESPTTVRG